MSSVAIVRWKGWLRNIGLSVRRVEKRHRHRDGGDGVGRLGADSFHGFVVMRVIRGLAQISPFSAKPNAASFYLHNIYL
jgi:hypothetical protein